MLQYLLSFQSVQVCAHLCEAQLSVGALPNLSYPCVHLVTSGCIVMVEHLLISVLSLQSVQVCEAQGVAGCDCMCSCVSACSCFKALSELQPMAQVHMHLHKLFCAHTHMHTYAHTHGHTHTHTQITGHTSTSAGVGSCWMMHWLLLEQTALPLDRCTHTHTLTPSCLCTVRCFMWK